MKNIYKILMLVIFINTLGCQPEDFDSIELNKPKTEDLAGTWKFVKLEQIDNNPTNTERASIDISDVYDFTNIELTFTADGVFSMKAENIPVFFKGDTSYKLLAEDGSDNNSLPYFIQLNNGSKLTLNYVAFKTGKMVFTIAAPTGSSAEYKYEFKKVN